jgi:nitrogen fixation protein FixH
VNVAAHRTTRAIVSATSKSGPTKKALLFGVSAFFLVLLLAGLLLDQANTSWAGLVYGMTFVGVALV